MGVALEVCLVLAGLVVCLAVCLVAALGVSQVPALVVVTRVLAAAAT